MLNLANNREIGFYPLSELRLGATFIASVRQLQGHGGGKLWNCDRDHACNCEMQKVCPAGIGELGLFSYS